jgi:hypothetical protein
MAGCDGNRSPPPAASAPKTAAASSAKAEPSETPKLTLDSPETLSTDEASKQLLDQLSKAVDQSKTEVKAADPALASTIDLSAIVLYRAEDFAAATDFPWPAMPTGKQTFVNVPFDISGAIFLWGARNEAAGMVYPKSMPKIAVARKAEAIYACHAAFFESVPGEAVFEIVCHYPDKEATLGPIECGGDTHDWFARGDSATTNARSTLAWSGVGKAGDRDQKIRMFVTALDNPHPDDEIVTLDLVSSQKQAAGCILAVTVGPKGLLKKVPEKEASEPQQ